MRYKRNSTAVFATYALDDNARESSECAASSCLIGLVTRGVPVSYAQDYAVWGYCEIYVVVRSRY
jgi:hypothetical protein